MTVYYVKTTCIATKENVYRNGEIHEYYSGKGQEQVACFGSPLCGDYDVRKYKAKDYGYKRVCDAKRSWIYNNPENTKYWKSTVEIVPYEC